MPSDHAAAEMRCKLRNTISQALGGYDVLAGHPSRLAIHQPNLFPRLKVLQKIASSDAWVILDDVQYVSREWQNRAYLRYLRDPRRGFWLTLPVHAARGRASRIGELKVVDLGRFKNKAKISLDRCYGRSRFWSWIEHYYELWAAHSVESLDTAAALSSTLCLSLLRIPVNVVRSSRISVAGYRSERLAGISAAVGAQVYIAGSGSRNYLEEAPFAELGISVAWQEWMTPTLHGGLDWRDVSFLDYVARYGPDRLRYHLIEEGVLRW